VALGWCLFDTAIGVCGIAWNGHAVCGVQLPASDEEAARRRMRERFPGTVQAEPPAHARHAIERIGALLRGERDDLSDVPLDMEGVPDFHRQVYAAARAIPPGRTLTYGDIARQLGQPGASRAVGQALGHNPFAPVVPCHRVLAAGNASGGFSAEGGVATKLRLLQIEQAQLGPQPGLF
jgi:methylated-DNA-[protein]-cysteine S-methyltransferase